MARISKTKIKQDLIDQLERRGVYGQQYLDLINDYMALWDVKNALILDIKERGVSVRYQNGQNQWGYKKNDSVSELTRVNAQMLRILQELGLRAIDIDVGDDDDDDEM